MNTQNPGPEAIPTITLPSGHTMRAVSGYADVRQVLTDSRFIRELHNAGSRMAAGTDISDDRDSLLNVDPPRHDHIRRTVAEAFAPRQIEQWRPRVLQVTEQLAGELIDSGPPADLMTTFAFPLPLHVICELLGVPQQDHEQFRHWSQAALTTSTADADRRAIASREFRGYVTRHLADRQTKSGDALIDKLLIARLTERELVSLTINLITAGHETTANLIGSGVYTLLAEDYYLPLAETSPLPADRMENLIEEILRHDTPASYGLPRLATEEVELPSGTIRKGETVLPMQAAANRDPEIFTNPDQFNTDRDHIPHLTFGHGPHFCLGARPGPIGNRDRADRAHAPAPPTPAGNGSRRDTVAHRQHGQRPTTPPRAMVTDQP